MPSQTVQTEEVKNKPPGDIVGNQPAKNQIGKVEGKSTSEIIATFANTTSGHGLVRIINAVSLIGRTFWLVVFLGACCWYGYLTFNLVTRFKEKPVQTELRIISAGFLPFPAVTFCNMNVFRAGKINATDFTSVTEFILAWQKRNEQISVVADDLSHQNLVANSTTGEDRGAFRSSNSSTRSNRVRRSGPQGMGSEDESQNEADDTSGKATDSNFGGNTQKSYDNTTNPNMQIRTEFRNRTAHSEDHSHEAPLQKPMGRVRRFVPRCPNMPSFLLPEYRSSLQKLCNTVQRMSSAYYIMTKCHMTVNGAYVTIKAACWMATTQSSYAGYPINSVSGTCPSARQYYMYLSSHRLAMSGTCMNLNAQQMTRCRVTVDRRTRSWGSVCRQLVLSKLTRTGCTSTDCATQSPSQSGLNCPSSASYYSRYRTHRQQIAKICRTLTAEQKSSCRIKVDAVTGPWNKVCKRYIGRAHRTASWNATSRISRVKCTAKYRVPEDCEALLRHCGPTGIILPKDKCLDDEGRVGTPGLCLKCKMYTDHARWQKSSKKIKEKIGVDVPEESLDDIVRSDDDYRAPTPAEFYFSFMKADDNDLKTFGHQLGDLIVDCRLNGVPCRARDFHRDVSRTYGNCYTFNHGLQTDDASNGTHYVNFTNKAGPLSGLEVILDLEPNEYVMMDDPIAVLSIQHPGVLPTPESQSILVRAGQESHLAIKRKYISRAKPPYSKCRDPKVRSAEMHGVTDHIYSTERCESECTLRSIERRCRCTQDLLGKRATNRGNSVDDNPQKRICSRFVQGDDACLKRVRTDQILGQLGCDCPTPCYEHLYMVSDFSMAWPNVKTLRDLMSLLRRKNDSRIEDMTNIVDATFGNYRYLGLHCEHC